MLFAKYSNEASFRSDFVRPLLTKMGFLAIAELDGSQEFGKDFVFSELTPFGFFRHYGVVVKHEKKIQQTTKNLCLTVLSQVKQAFSVSFRLPDSSQECHISSVLVLNSGTITPGARTWLRSELIREHYGDNVHIFDGERLSQLDLQVAFQHRELLVPRLVGLEINLKLNQVVLLSIANSLPSFAEGRGCFTQALEDYLSAPFLTMHLDSQEIAILLQECRIINTINQRHLDGVRGQREVKALEVDRIRTLILGAHKRAKTLQAAVKLCLNTFHPMSG